MKIVMVTSYPKELGKVVGGVGGVSYYLTQELAKIPDAEIEVIVPEAPFKEERRVSFDGIQVHYLPFPSHAGTLSRLVWATPKAICRKLAELTCDIVHVQGVASWTRGIDRPHVFTIHGIPERDALFKTDRPVPRLRSMVLKCVEGRARRRNANIIVINPYVRDLIGKDLRENTWDIENPVADDFFKIERSPQSGRILYGGTIIPRKNITGLIDAFAILARSRSDAQLRIAGDGIDNPYGQECLKLVNDYNLEERVHFLGSLSVEEIQHEMSLAQCLVLCAFQETAPLIIEEAMAAGLPVVASRLCGMPYMLVDGETGKLVDPDDAQDIADGLGFVLQAEHYEVMSQGVKAFAEKHFRASIVASKTYEVYKSVLAT